MPQSSIFPIRYGLQVPRGENLQANEIYCEGGLDLTQTVLETRPGYASKLINFEVSLLGGYRRISGFNKFSNTVVPGQNQLLGVAVFPLGSICAFRQDSVATTTYNFYTSSGAGWTKQNGATTLNYTAGMVVQSYPYNWNGTYTIAFADGVNPAYTWNGTTFTLLNGTGSAANPQFVCEFAGYLVVAGYSSNLGAIKFSATLNATDWLTVDGAAEIVIGDTVTGIKPWRNMLIVFCRNSIYRIVGTSTSSTSATPFTLQRITNRVGCLASRTIKEINGDLVFLAQDGLRTISGTAKIGDTEIGSISRPIQSIVSAINPSSTPCHSVVVRRKTQYRLFYPDPNLAAVSCKGVIAGIRRFRDGHEDWEFGELQGIKPACADSGYWTTDNNEYVVHGGYDGFVYRQEQGGTFDGTFISEVYKTVPLEFGDRTIRKVFHRITPYITADSLAPTNLFLTISYDLGKSGVINPNQIALSNLGATMGTAWDTGALWDAGGTVVWDTSGTPSYRQAIQGSGFLAEFQFNSVSNSNSYTIQGFSTEYFPAGRR